MHKTELLALTCLETWWSSRDNAGSPSQSTDFLLRLSSRICSASSFSFSQFFNTFKSASSGDRGLPESSSSLRLLLSTLGESITKVALKFAETLLRIAQQVQTSYCMQRQFTSILNTTQTFKTEICANSFVTNGVNSEKRCKVRISWTVLIRYIKQLRIFHLDCPLYSALLKFYLRKNLVNEVQLMNVSLV